MLLDDSSRFGCIGHGQKTFSCGQPGGHSIRVLNERSVSDGGNLCPLWFVILISL